MKYYIFSYLLLITGVIFPQQYYFKKYTTWEGLSQNTIRAIQQDSLGRIWIGTDDGISIYDGHNFENYSFKEGMGDNVVNWIFNADSSTMWVATANAGISVFVKPRFEKDTVIRVIKGRKYLADNAVSKIYRDSKGRIWFCTDSGLTRWSNSDIENNVIRNFYNIGTIGRVKVNTITEDPSSNIWIGTSKGLVKFKRGTFYFEKKSPKGIYTLAFEKNKGLWIGTQNGLYLLANRKFFKPFKNSILSSTFIYFIDKSRPTKLWFCTLKGLFKYDGKKLINFNKSKGLEKKFILSLLADRNGNYWVGTVNGLDKLSSDNFYYFHTRSLYSYISRLVPEKNGTVLAVTSDGLFDIANGKISLDNICNDLPSKNITSILLSEDKIKWIGTDRGLFKFSRDGVKSFTVSDGLKYDFVFSLAEERKDSIWVGSKSFWDGSKGGLNLIVKNKVVHPAFLHLLPDNPLRSLLYDNKGNLWLGYWSKGLWMITRNHSVTHFSAKNGISAEDIRNLYLDREKRIWIMTRYKGVFKYSNGKFTQYSEKDGLNSNWVFNTVEDKKGAMWFNTSKGVCRLEGRHWYKFNYGGELLSGEVWASAIDYKQNLWFANVDNIFIYNPVDDDKSSPPEIYFKKFDVNKKPDELFKNKLILNEGDNVSIEFSTVSFNRMNSIFYQYRLNGFDNGWSNLSKRNYINFTHLPPGKYTFLVKARNSDGLWSKVNSNISFIIRHAFWQKWWFIGLSAIFTISLISLITVIIYRYRVRQLLKLERIRTKIATDLHDDIGANLSTISIFSELAIMKLNDDPDNSSHLLEKIGGMARELVDSMSDIVWAINPDTDSLSDIIIKMNNFAFEILQAKGISIIFSVDKNIPEIKLSMEERRNLLLIFKESINNAAKYSAAAKVNIFIKINSNRKKYFPENLILIIEDNGTGFDKNDYVPGNGLKNIEKRSKEINAEILIKSNIGEGTTIRVSLPLGK